jgi:hypothetical protein
MDSAMDVAVESGAAASSATAAMEAMMADPAAPCHGSGAMVSVPSEAPAADPDCTACDLNCGSLFLLEPALNTGQTPLSAATRVPEGHFGPLIGSLFPALRPPIV